MNPGADAYYGLRPIQSLVSQALRSGSEYKTLSSLIGKLAFFSLKIEIIKSIY